LSGPGGADALLDGLQKGGVQASSLARFATWNQESTGAEGFSSNGRKKLMKDWYTTYVDETRRRQDEVKFAEAYRLAKEGLPDQLAGKAHRRFFISLGARLIHWGINLLVYNQGSQLANPPEYAKESRG